MSISTKINLVRITALAALGIVLSTSIHQQVNAQTTSTQSGSTLNPNETLQRGKSLLSKNLCYKLQLQDDGNLVLTKTRNNRPLWASGTNKKSAQKTTMQADGNLVLTDYDNKAVWASNTNRNDGSRLILQDDGNLVIYTPSNNRAVWATNTENPSKQPEKCTGVTEQIEYTLKPNQALKRGESATSKNQQFKLHLQDDGNLVLTKVQGNQPLWASGTDKKAVQKATMQADGNLVLTGYDGKAIWASDTDKNNGAGLVVQDDGNVVIYSPVGNRAVWATNTVTRSN
jgi:prophage tail gpP-like protein